MENNQQKLEAIIKLTVCLMAAASCLAALMGQMGMLPGGWDWLISHAGSGPALAMAIVASVDTQSAEALGLNCQDVSREITRMNPDRFPLDTIMRHCVKKTRRVHSQEVKYYQKNALPMTDGLDTTATGEGQSMGDPCSSFDGMAAEATSVFVKVKNPRIWRPKDTLLMRKVEVQLDTDGSMAWDGRGTQGTYDQMFYVAQKSGNVLELMPIGGMRGTNGVVVTPSFSNSTTLYRMGSAMAEKDARTQSIAMLPASSVNYCQNFMCQIEMSTFERMTQTEVPLSLTDHEVDMIYNMRSEMESSFIWGTKGKYDTDGDRTYFTDGIARQITKVVRYGDPDTGSTTIKEGQYLDWMKELFTHNAGSTERILLAGGTLLAEIEKLREGYKFLNGTGVQETYLGVKCTSIVSSFGTLKVIHAPLFDEHGWSDKGLIIDPEHIYKEVFQPMTARNLDFKTTGEKNVDAKILQEVSCLVLRYPDCHAIVMPFERKN